MDEDEAEDYMINEYVHVDLFQTIYMNFEPLDYSASKGTLKGTIYINKIATIYFCENNGLIVAEDLGVIGWYNPRCRAINVWNVVNCSLNREIFIKATYRIGPYLHKSTFAVNWKKEGF